MSSSSQINSSLPAVFLLSRKLSRSGFPLLACTHVVTVHSQVWSARNKTWVMKSGGSSELPRKGRGSDGAISNSFAAQNRVHTGELGSPPNTRLPQNKGWLVIVCEFKCKRKAQNSKGAVRSRAAEKRHLPNRNYKLNLLTWFYFPQLQIVHFCCVGRFWWVSSLWH